MEAKEAKETIADIVAEFREMVHKSVDGIIAVKADVIADRIESAWNREHGNAAAMREALYMMRRISDEMNGETFGKGDEEIVKGWANTLRYYSDKALSEPPRNCDVMDWRTAWAKWRTENHPQNPVGYRECYESTTMFMDWYTGTAERKGECDGSK